MTVFFIVLCCAFLALVCLLFIRMCLDSNSHKELRFDTVFTGTKISSGKYDRTDFIHTYERYKAPDGTSVRKGKCFRGVVNGQGLKSFGLSDSDRVYGRSLAETGGNAEYMRNKYVVFRDRRRNNDDPFSRVTYDTPLLIRKCIGFVDIYEENGSICVESDFNVPDGYTKESMTDAIRNAASVDGPCRLIAAITGNRNEYEIEMFDKKDVVAVIERTEDAFS